MSEPGNSITAPWPGLSPAEAARRLAAYGPNRLKTETLRDRVREFLKILADPMAVMLIVAASLYFLLGDTRDGTILLAAVAPVLLVDVVLDFRSRKALQKLSEAMAPRAKVVRDGRESTIPTEEVVPGDFLVLKEGDRVHADGILRQCANFLVDESPLTGEAEPIPKRAEPQGEKGDAESYFFAGSMVLAGQAYGEVLQTGFSTRLGNIARMVASEIDEPAPIQRKTAAMVRRLGVVAAAVISGVFLLALFREPTVSAAFLSAVSLGIAAIPEEFPLILTVFMSLGAWRLGQRGILIKRLASVETLGSTTVICVDKTGTLTQGRFVLEEHLPVPESLSEEEVLEASILACELSPADPMERAVLEHAGEHGVRTARLQESYDLMYDFDFDPAGKHMSHVWREKGNPNSWRIVAKGALEGVLEHCDASSAERQWIERENSRLAGQGKRVLAVAGRTAEAFVGRREEDERDMKLYGLLSFRDPLRAEVVDAVEQCQMAGIRIKLITGDHLLTAHAVADAAGIEHEPESLLNGSELEGLGPEALRRKALEGAVFARTKPEQKYAIVDALKKSGEVVAMTGDGINDAPALRRSDIGIAMGRKGTEVARAAADMVLLEDSFSAVVETVREGRRVFDNIQKAFLYLLPFKMPAVGVTLACPVLGAPLLLLPIHLVWLELIQHPVSALVFEQEPPDPDIMRRPPRPPGRPILERRDILIALLTGFFLTGTVLGTYLFHLPQGAAHARAMALGVDVLGSLLLIWCGRAVDKPWWKVSFPRTVRFWGVVGLAALSLPAVLEIPWLADIFQVEPLTLGDWGQAALLAFAAVGWRMFGLPKKRV